jgi:hypothetical protein
MFVEPLLIYPKLECVAYWVHPEILDLIKDMDNQDGHYTGNLIRADLIFDDTRIVHIIFATDYEGVKEIMTDDGMPEYLGRLSLLLSEPVWTPGGDVFCETEYGKIVQKLFPMFDEDFKFAVSSDVSLATDGDEWWFDD